MLVILFLVDCKIYNLYKSNYLNVKYYKKINLISVKKLNLL